MTAALRPQTTARLSARFDSAPAASAPAARQAGGDPIRRLSDKAMKQRLHAGGILPNEGLVVRAVLPEASSEQQMQRRDKQGGAAAKLTPRLIETEARRVSAAAA